MEKIKWLNPNNGESAIRVFRLGSGKLGLLVSNAKSVGADMEKAGFKPVGDGHYFRESTRYNAGEMTKIFPNLVVDEVERDAIILAPKDPGYAEVHFQEYLGMNHLGMKVWKDVFGRFAQSQDEENSVFHDADGHLDAVFLRAKTYDDLMHCADGFVKNLENGIKLTQKDVLRFASVIYEQDIDVFSPRARQVQEAVEATLVKQLRIHGGLNKSGFDWAVDTYSRQPTMTLITGDSLSDQQYSTPLPMALAAQKILLSGDKGEGLILEPTIGNAALVSLVQDQSRVRGVELDASRVEHCQHQGLNVRAGDFTKYRTEERFGYVISNPPFGGLEAPERYTGGVAPIKVARLDHLLLLKSLELREDHGRSVYIVGGDSPIDARAGQVIGGSRSLLNWLYDHYNVESVVEVNGDLYSRQGASWPLRMLVIGDKRPQEEALLNYQKQNGKNPDVPETLRVLYGWDEVWDYAEQLSQRLGDTTENEAFGVDERGDNEYQRPYKAYYPGEATKMVPTYLADPIERALAKLKHKVGSIEEFVGGIEGLSPEQGDAVALAKHRIQNNAGFLVGDQTGVGKGRTLAALAVESMKQGKPVVFLTDKANLFSDFYRDLKDIGEDKYVGTPLILNAGEAVIDLETGERLFNSTSRSELATYMADQMPLVDTPYRLMLSTYSQFNRNQNTSVKSRWLAEAVKGGTILLDESHRAAGEDSNIGKNVVEAVAQSDACIYSSATFAKGAKSFGVYSKLFPAGMSVEEIGKTLEIGGEPLMETLSAMLAEDGAMIRREHDLSKIAFRIASPDGDGTERNRRLSDQMSEILAALAALSGDVSQVIGKEQRRIKDYLDKLPDAVRAGNRMMVANSNFGSRLFNIQRQFLLAIKVGEVIADAEQALRDGRKPVIALEQTNESILKEMLAAGDIDEEGVEGEVELDEAANVGEADFRALLYRLVDKLTVINTRDGYGSWSSRTAMSFMDSSDEVEAFSDLLSEVRGKIAALDPLPLSPIDEVVSQLEKKGIRVGEISGRKLTYRDGSLIPRVILKGDRTNTVSAFNNGGLDCVVLSRAGAVGLSLHSYYKFKDQRQREMLLLQAQGNIDDQIQMIGRVARTGEVVPPVITMMASGLPAENRPLAMLNSKLRKLSANTSGNRRNKAELDDVPDLLNSLGNQVAKEYLSANPHIARTLDVDMDYEGEDEYFVNRVTGRIALLPVSEQELIFEQLEGEFKTRVAEMERKGISPFKLAFNDYKARVVGRDVFLPGKPGSESVFDTPVYLTDIQWERDIPRISGEIIDKHLDQGRNDLTRYLRALGVGDLVELGMKIVTMNRAYLDEQAKMAGYASFEEMKSIDPTVLPEAGKKQIEQLEKIDSRVREYLVGQLNVMDVGRVIDFTGNDNRRVSGLVVGILPPETLSKAKLLGQYELRVLVPGESGMYSLTLNQLYDDPDFQMSFSSEETMRWEFENAPTGKQVFKRTILDGNLFAAAKHLLNMPFARGAGRNYSLADGGIAKGLFLPAGFTAEDLRSLPREIEDAMLEKYLIEHEQAYFDTELHKFAAMSLFGGEIEIALPGKKGEWGHIIANKAVNDVVGGFNGTRTMMKARFPLARLGEFKQICKAKLFAPGAQYAEFEQRMLNDGEEDHILTTKAARA